MTKSPPKPTSDQNFQKFAAQLVSPSEVFESRSSRNRINISESLDLLGSLASLTRSSLMQSHLPETTLLNAAVPPLPTATNTAPGTNPGVVIPPASNGVQYGTSRKEYRQALEDQRIAEALSQLQTHRENTQRARQTQTRSPSHKRSGAVLSQPDSTSTSNSATQGFQHASLPDIAVSVKPSPMKKSPGAYQTILRPFYPQK